MRPFRAVPCDHCRFRAVAEDFSVQVDTFRRRVALPDVLLAHPYSKLSFSPHQSSADQWSLFIWSLYSVAPRSGVLRADGWSPASGRRH
jgi:hypothetical protein